MLPASNQPGFRCRADFSRPFHLKKVSFKLATSCSQLAVRYADRSQHVGKHVGVNVGVSDKVSDKMSEKVFSALQADPESTIAELATQVGVATRTIERALTKLPQENRVTRIGADRGGHWKVLN